MVIFVICRADSLMSARLGIPKRETSLYHRAISEVSGVPAV